LDINKALFSKCSYIITNTSGFVNEFLKII
jgi:hypothetical protein